MHLGKLVTLLRIQIIIVNTHYAVVHKLAVVISHTCLWIRKVLPRFTMYLSPVVLSPSRGYSS